MKTLCPDSPATRTRSTTEGRPVTRESFRSPEDLDKAEEALSRSMKTARKHGRIRKIFRLKKELTSLRQAIRKHLRENPNARRIVVREATEAALELYHSHKPMNEAVTNPDDATYTKAMDVNKDVISNALAVTHRCRIRT